MKRLAKPGAVLLLSRRQLLRYTAGAFMLGSIFGGLGYHSALSIADPAPVVVPAIFAEVGNDLCNGWDGLSKLVKVGEGHYSFICRNMAVFPDVQVTYAPESK